MIFLETLKNNKLINQFLRYVVVGGLAFVVDFGTLFILTEYAHLYYLTSSAVSFILGLNVNYFLSKKFVFGSSRLKSVHVEYVAIIFISLTGLLLNQLLLWFITEKLGLFYLYSKLISAAIVLVYNFAIRKITVFD